MNQDYVLAFIFDYSYDYLIMIRKAKPGWQAGKLSVPGGHIKDGETVHEALLREVQEETGLNLSTECWRAVCLMDDLIDPERKVHIFMTVCDMRVIAGCNGFESDGETCYICQTDSVKHTIKDWIIMLPNIPWLMHKSIAVGVFGSNICKTEKLYESGDTKDNSDDSGESGEGNAENSTLDDSGSGE